MKTNCEDFADATFLESFPEVPQENRPRELVFDRIESSYVKALEQRGYAVTCIKTLPRKSTQENVLYLLKLLQGITDGTIILDKGRAEALSLEMKAYGLLSNKSLNISLQASLENDDIMKLLNWKDSRHTLGASTVVNPKQLEAFLQGVNKYEHGQIGLQSDNLGSDGHVGHDRASDTDDKRSPGKRSLRGTKTLPRRRPGSSKAV